jgi:hypothetical protein
VTAKHGKRGTKQQRARLKSAGIDARTIIANKGYYPADEGKNAVEIYYEFFPAFEREAHLDDIQLTELERADITDLEQWRDTCRYFAQQGIGARRVASLLKNYRTRKGGRHATSGTSSGGNYLTPTERETSEYDESVARIFSSG